MNDERAVVYFDGVTGAAVACLVAGANVADAMYVRWLLRWYVAGDPLTSLYIAITLDKVWIAVDALLKTQTWAPALRGTVREIIERRAGRLDV